MLDLTQYRKAGRYIRANGRIICLNCTAYFQSRDLEDVDKCDSE